MKRWIKKLEARITAITVESYTAPRPFTLQWVLVMASKLYGEIVSLRLWLYDRGILKSRKLPCPVISVGNIVAGGSGKTPMTLYLAEMLKKNGFRPVVLSRGYGGSCEKGTEPVVAGDGKHVFFSPDAVGDEPFMMAAKRIFPVVVCRDRFQGGMTAIGRFSQGEHRFVSKGSRIVYRRKKMEKIIPFTTDLEGLNRHSHADEADGQRVMILDDGFQHIQLKRDLDIVLMDCEKPLGNGRLLPAGRLREPIRALKRADVMVLTRCPDGAVTGKEGCTGGDGMAPFKLGRPGATPFATRHLPVLQRYIPIPDNENKNICSFQDLSGRKAMLFSGIANNFSFRETLKNIGISVVEHLEFSDHHMYKSEEIFQIFDQFATSSADVLITTEKDHARLGFRNRWPMDFVVVGVGIDFVDPREKERFDARILSSLKRKMK